jgi:exodeoxyribonuclease VII large subunit
MSAPQILSVGELTRQIKSTLETGFQNISVQGEISNFKIHTSGHAYCTIKDAEAQIQVVMWRSRVALLAFTPQDGMKVVARGKVTVYPPRGQYQLDVMFLQPAGVGELQLAFEQLKQKLAKEGLFESERKKPLPGFPQVIGIVTSPTGAAVRDMIQILSRRYPLATVILAPVRVQGAGAAQEIAGAIGDFNNFGGVDVLIVGRGGGSLEDLWAFNEEIVARAIAGSGIPVISAVGHETDFTIADFVADLRAPTPSAAAELVAPNRADLVEIVRNYWYNAEQSVRSRLNSERDHVNALFRSYALRRPADLLRQFSQQIDELRRNLEQLASHRVSLLRERQNSLRKRIESVNPDQILRRGYAIVSLAGSTVGSAALLRQGENIDLRFHDGERKATID